MNKTRWLFKDNLLPDNTIFLGYARSKLTVDDVIMRNSYKFMKVNIL